MRGWRATRTVAGWRLSGGSRPRRTRTARSSTGALSHAVQVPDPFHLTRPRQREDGRVPRSGPERWEWAIGAARTIPKVPAKGAEKLNRRDRGPLPVLTSCRDAERPPAHGPFTAVASSMMVCSDADCLIPVGRATSPTPILAPDRVTPSPTAFRLPPRSARQMERTCSVTEQPGGNSDSDPPGSSGGSAIGWGGGVG